MIKDTWVSVDIDYWNPSAWNNRAKINFYKFLESMPNNIQTHLTIEHHETLRPLRKAIRNNILSIPFNIVHIDQHHDYYFNSTRGKKIDCGNFMWSIPKEWYKLFKWYQPDDPSEWDWEDVKNKLKIKTICSRKRPKINWDRVGLITFTLSPDYCEDLISKTEKMIKTITKKFNLDRTIKKRNAEPENSVQSWGYKLLEK
jgi:hypothetical protein